MLYCFYCPAVGGVKSYALLLGRLAHGAFLMQSKNGGKLSALDIADTMRCSLA